MVASGMAVVLLVWYSSFTLCLVLSLGPRQSGNLPSCAGRCDTVGNNPVWPCQCNNLCVNFGDCCEDYEEVCLSCLDRCGTDYNNLFPCQCNDVCSQKGNCCQDFDQYCDESSRLVTDDDLRTLAEALLEMENNVRGLLTFDLQGQSSPNGGDEAPEPLFAGELPEEVTSIESIAKMMALFDNYEPNTTYPEEVTPEEEEETSAFLDTIIDTPIMQTAYQFLLDKGEIQDDEVAFKERLREMWFDMYPRDGPSPGSSGFEHVFMGELQIAAVTGFHGWVWFFLQELEQRVDYFGYLTYRDLGDKGVHLEHTFKWDGKRKPISSLYIGASPELEMALLTVCFITRPNSICPVRMAGEDLHIQTYVEEYNGGIHVGTAYFDISG
ncbi:unnamed protein product [Darwinula stevensoni]|uniref:Uncharacterized protein n=1 Tax=Darwinula stevensoni TaxID=69355 RepID=A0A7R8XAU5_9CRUS|nr:unnamed protein product [Darwinula stevensoni]CAG0884109.1 unnamed protein product [Darwinula stevensoni]